MIYTAFGSEHVHLNLGVTALKLWKLHDASDQLVLFCYLFDLQLRTNSYPNNSPESANQYLLSHCSIVEEMRYLS